MNDKFSQGGNSPYLKEEYRDFGKSQLQEMLYLTDEQMEQARPDMTAKEIREIRKPEEPHEKEKIRPYDRGCITGKSPSGNCVCCGHDGVECCAQCDKGCNGKCGWLDVAPAQQEHEEQVQGQTEIQDYPELLPEEHIASDSKEQQESVAPSQQEEDRKDYMNPPEDLDTEETAEEIEVIAPADPEEKYEELSDKTDMELLRDLLDEAQRLLKIMNEAYTDNDVRVRKQKLVIGAYAGMIADLDQEDIPETIQPELPIFKNNDQRKEWLRNYQDWGLWYEDENIGARYYKYDFDNGARLIAETYVQPEGVGYFIPESCYLHLIGGPVDNKNKWSVHANYCKYPNSETELVEFLKYMQKER